MKEHKNGVKSDLKKNDLKRHVFGQKVKLNQSGATLIELITAVASSMLVIAGAVMVMQMGMHEFYMLNEQNRALESLERASVFLRLYTQNAVNINGWSPGGAAGTYGVFPNNPATADAFGIVDQSRGYIGGMALENGNAGFDSRLLVANGTNGRAHKIGAFLVENGTFPENALADDQNAQGSVFRAMAIWYQVPNTALAGPMSSGVIYLDFDATGAPTPDAGDIWFNYITRFRAEVIPAPATPANPNGPAWQVIYTLSARYFLAGAKQNEENRY